MKVAGSTRQPLFLTRRNRLLDPLDSTAHEKASHKRRLAAFNRLPRSSLRAPCKNLGIVDRPLPLQIKPLTPESNDFGYWPKTNTGQMYRYVLQCPHASSSLVLWQFEIIANRSGDLSVRGLCTSVACVRFARRLNRSGQWKITQFAQYEAAAQNPRGEF